MGGPSAGTAHLDLSWASTGSCFDYFGEKLKSIKSIITQTFNMLKKYTLNSL